MQTILRVLNLAQDAGTENELVDFIDEEASSCIVKGDLLGAGEWLASRLNYSSGIDPDATAAKILALWASPTDLSYSPSDIRDLASNSQEFDRSALCTALVGLLARRPKLILRDPDLLRDLTFKYSQDIAKLFDLDQSRPTELREHATIHLISALSKATEALTLFQNAKCISARTPATELLKRLRQLKPFLLIRERPLLSHVEVLLGAGFREFCQSYERSDTQKVVLRLPDIRQQAQDALRSTANENSVMWHILIKPVAEHLITITDEASRSCKLALTPALKLSTSTFKSDLGHESAVSIIPARIVNEGVGNAVRVRLDPTVIGVSVCSPKEPFDLPGGTDRIIELECKVARGQANSSTRLAWLCADISGQKYTFSDELRLEQQRAQPDWSLLRDDPPYTVNPIKTRHRLFGRGPQLDKLLLRAAAGTSTFVWGQKRVGKTSLLQVIQEEISTKGKFTCIFLRMGELAAMHEGQMAHTIAARLASALPSCGVDVPPEQEFGAGLGRLVPFVELLTTTRKEWHFVVIIDEFDDLDPAFYTGERGRLFVKALRSLSEIGLTFLFAGSERMNVIYAKHALELNKWTNAFVDSIVPMLDRRDLIIKPVQDQLEYQQSAADGIAEYCSGNPFFMHLVCYGLFERCVAERRTFISEADFQSNRQALAETLGMTNFAHFWEDNPVLDRDENRRRAAENCLALCCITCLGGYFRTRESVWEQQDNLNLSGSERLSAREMSMTIDRLRSRKILADSQQDGKIEIAVPILTDWLKKHAELVLLPVWRRFVSDKSLKPQQEFGVLTPSGASFDPTFPIAEDDLLSVSQNLVFCGKQKDVAEIRTWLRQFDDDNRIEIAFALLRRLTEKGYVSDGAREYALSKATEGINARRLELGAGKWVVMRGRKDNLCLSHVDSDLKSGANLTRELMKRLGPSKAGDAKEISNWITTHASADPLVVLLDDFSSTGSTICRGLEKWKSETKDGDILERYFKEDRILLVLLYALGSAIDAIHECEPRLRVLPLNVLGADVKAFDPDAGIFSDSQEIDFAREVMMQIGRELTPQTPLGYGDQALLISFHNTVPNNTLPIFWSNGRVNERNWKPLFSRV